MKAIAACDGNKGYAENADELIARYEAVAFAAKHEALLRLIPNPCMRVLDVAAGAGGDAAWLAERGSTVVAVEPTAEFRAYARRRHASPKIEWIDDSLPRLRRVVRRRETFDLILIAAVWMHLEEGERSAAMPVVASLLSPGGLLYISLRHGAIPEGRRMFDVTATETSAKARAAGLRPLLEAASPSLQERNREAGITWSQLVFTKQGRAMERLP
jgi:SAM-dependent methyltransferase